MIKNKIFKIYVLAIFLFLTIVPENHSMEGKLRVRLREHFEWISVQYGQTGETAKYYGISNTLNAFYEKPFKYSYGLSFSPVLGSAQIQGGVPIQTNEKIKLWSMGVEGKYFFFPERYGFFGRLGITGNILDTRGALGTLAGAGYYGGLGWEFKIWKLGIAPEVAIRHVILEKNSRALAFTPSIGIHFYVLNEKIK